MEITREFIESEIKGLTHQERQHTAAAQQCAGARAAYETMLKRMDAPEPEPKATKTTEEPNGKVVSIKEPKK